MCYIAKGAQSQMTLDARQGLGASHPRQKVYSHYSERL